MDLPLDVEGLTLDDLTPHQLLDLIVDDDGMNVAARLDPAAVQALAGALCQWLADNGHTLPLLELHEDEELEVVDLPVQTLEHTRPAGLTVPATFSTPEHAVNAAVLDR